MNLVDTKISYCIISAYDADRNESENQKRNDNLESVLYAKGYMIESIKLYNNGDWLTSYFVWLQEDSVNDIIFILKTLNIDSCILKLKNDASVRKIDAKGFQTPLNVIQYNPELSDTAYMIKGLSYSFLEAKQYKIIENKSDLKSGMVIELFNNNKWVEKVVENVDIEWDSIYKLFAKYSKLRIIL